MSLVLFGAKVQTFFKKTNYREKEKDRKSLFPAFCLFQLS